MLIIELIEETPRNVMTFSTPSPCPGLSRRHWLCSVAGMGAVGAGLSLAPEVRVLAQQVQDFIEGPPVPDVKPEQLSPHVWMVYADGCFPTQENRG